MFCSRAAEPLKGSQRVAQMNGLEGHHHTCRAEQVSRSQHSCWAIRAGPPPTKRLAWGLERLDLRPWTAPLQEGGSWHAEQHSAGPPYSGHHVTPSARDSFMQSCCREGAHGPLLSQGEFGVICKHDRLTFAGGQTLCLQHGDLQAGALLLQGVLDHDALRQGVRRIVRLAGLLQ